jgi:hypothetical protein
MLRSPSGKRDVGLVLGLWYQQGDRWAKCSLECIYSAKSQVAGTTYCKCSGVGEGGTYEVKIKLAGLRISVAVLSRLYSCR